MIKQLLNVCGAGVLCGLVGGCVAVAAIGSKVAGPPPVPAEYKLAKEPTLILVESYQNPNLYEVESERIERDLAYAFTEQKAFPVVPSAKVAELKANKGAEFAHMDVPTIARAVGAKQVIYVNLLRFTADPAIGSETNRGEIEAMVKVIDAETGHALWPRDTSEGRDISYKTPALSQEGTSRDAVQQQLYKHVDDEIVHLFTQWVDEDQAGNPPESYTSDSIK